MVSDLWYVKGKVDVVHDVIREHILTLMDIVEYSPDDHARISHQVRIQLGDRLERMLKTLEPLIEGQYGEPPMPGHLQAYLAGIKLFGAMYQVDKPPRGDEDLIPVEKVTKMLEAARVEAAAEAVQAVQARKQIASSAEFAAAAQKLRTVLDGGEETG
jgi:hypothetical protein